jgi:hypothetical protein
MVYTATPRSAECHSIPAPKVFGVCAAFKSTLISDRAHLLPLHEKRAHETIAYIGDDNDFADGKGIVSS